MAGNYQTLVTTDAPARKPRLRRWAILTVAACIGLTAHASAAMLIGEGSPFYNQTPAQVHAVLGKPTSAMIDPYQKGESIVSEWFDKGQCVTYRVVGGELRAFAIDTLY
jgi:hypothetical protein